MARTKPQQLTAAQLRERLGHPVIDGDGHTIEYLPALESYLRDEGLRGLADLSWRPATLEERLERRVYYHSSLTLPAENTYDLATANGAALLYRRLDELGLDYAMVFPSAAQIFCVFPREDARRGACRALNNYMADMFGEFRDRLCPVGVIPMYSPTEAIEELDFAVGRGLKAVMIGGYAQRAAGGRTPDFLDPSGWLDTFGIDSEYDYDPFWARCVHHGIAPSSHTLGMGWGSRRSPTNYVYNQIGHFAATGEALTKSLFLGGVTRRFPTLRFGMLEGGVGWACALYADLVNRWQKRNAGVLHRYDKRHIDEAQFDRLVREFAPDLLRFGEPLAPGIERGAPERERQISEDDFARCEITSEDDIRELFVERFTFGCEADDPATKLAFDRSYNPGHAQLRAIFSSDIGHWDVPDMTEVLGEAYELVERGWLDEQQFQDFTFRNTVRFYTTGDPDFFRGTSVAAEATRVTAGG